MGTVDLVCVPTPHSTTSEYGDLHAEDPPPLPAAVQSPLETYLREINETSLLSADEEQELAIAIGQGDTAARDRMVRANLRLVVNIARGYTGKGLGLQDLIEEGNLGLLRAVEGFDPAMGTRFSTYASYWIKQSIKRALINTAKTIRIPAYMVELLSKWRRATIRLSEELGRTPTPEEIARVLGLPKQEAADHQEGHSHLQLDAADRSGRGGLVAGRDGDGRTAQNPEDEMVEERQPDPRHAAVGDDGPARSDGPADALRPGRQRAADAEGNRRDAGPDARTRPPDRDRSPGQTGRRAVSRLTEARSDEC